LGWGGGRKLEDKEYFDEEYFDGWKDDFLKLIQHGQRETEIIHPGKMLACNTTAEIIYHGCYRSFKVEAPSLRVSDVGLQTTNVTDYGGCRTGVEADLKGVERPLNAKDTSVEIQKLPRFQCSTAVPGRPLFDLSGKQIQASASVRADASWAQSSPEERGNLDFFDVKGNHAEKSKLALEWTERGLGEHASVASFAAFTVSLMTNDAPPELIRDSLQAALDEVDHAVTSFDVASMLSGETIEPGPLPPSEHSFDNNLAALIQHTFEDGCIDETLSALAAAAEAHRYECCTSSITNARCLAECDLREKLTKIAHDEARHSSLAWRTIHWGCHKDRESCIQVLEPYLQGESTFSDALKSRFYSLYNDLESDWEMIHSNLLPYIGIVSEDVNYCENYNLFLAEHDSKLSIVGEVAFEIVNDVLCRDEKGKIDGLPSTISEK